MPPWDARGIPFLFQPRHHPTHPPPSFVLCVVGSPATGTQSWSRGAVVRGGEALGPTLGFACVLCCTVMLDAPLLRHSHHGRYVNRHGSMCVFSSDGGTVTRKKCAPSLHHCLFSSSSFFCAASAVVPHFLLRTSSAAVPHFFRTSSAAVPHSLRASSALLPQRSLTFPHFFRTAAEIWRRTPLWAETMCASHFRPTETRA